MKRMKRVYSFLVHNSNRPLYIKILFLSFLYRISILTVPMKTLQRYMGTINEESTQELIGESYRQAYEVAQAVTRVCRHTPWQSKCLVQALIAQHLLKKHQIPSTLYLGVGKVGEEMIAHAWLRSGEYYLTGGCGEGYALVAKFRT